MKKLLAVMAILAMAVAGASADYVDDFDSYTPGDINGQGPWIDFGGAVTTDVSTAQAHSGTQSLALTSGPSGGYGSDVYIPYLDGSLVTSGQYVFSYWHYTPSTYDGEMTVYLSQLSMPSFFTTGIKGNHITTPNDAVSPGYHYHSNGVVPMLLDQWVEVRTDIDLDANTATAYYNGVPFHTGPWVTWPDDVAGPSIGGLNVWSSKCFTGGVTSYIDDISLVAAGADVVAVPEPATLALLGLGAIGLLIRRR